MKFYAVNAKVKAMRANLLEKRDYVRLCTEPGTSKIDTTVSSFDSDLAKILPFLDRNAQKYIKTNKGLDKLDCSSRQSMRRVLGAEADIRNILMLFRLKKHYRIVGNRAFVFLSPLGYRLNTAQTARLVHSRGLWEFTQMVKNSYYGRFFKETADFARGEQIVSRAVKAQFKNEYLYENIAVVCGYLFARMLEEKNVRAIVTGIENGLKPEKIFELLHI